MLDNVPSCNLVLYQGNIMMQPWENCKNPNFGPSWGPQKFLTWVLPLLLVRKCSKLSSYEISRKTNGSKLIKMTKKLNLGPILAHLTQFGSPNNFWQILPLLVIRHCSNLSPNAVIKKNQWTKLEKIKKN